MRSLSIKYRIFIFFYFLFGMNVLFDLYLGLASFFSTVYIYSLIGFALYGLFKKLKVRANLQLLGFSILLSFFLAEVVLRFVVRYPLTYSERASNGYCSLYTGARQDFIQNMLSGSNKKDFHTLEFDSGELRRYRCSDYRFPDEHANALGLRGSLPGKGKKITLFLGDSFTEGVGAPADSSIPALVGGYIAQHDSESAFLNAGISANDLFFDWQMVKKLAPHYNLKQLVFISNTTDISDVLIRGGNERFGANGSLSYNQSPWWEPLYAVSFVFRLVAHNALKIGYLLLSPQQEQDGRKDAVKKMTNLVKNEIVPWSKANGVPVLIVIIPMEPDTRPPGTEFKMLADGMKAVSGIRVLDCMPVIKSQPDIHSLYWPTDGHFKARGYNIISQYVIDSCFRQHPD